MCCFYFHSTGTLPSASHFFFSTRVLKPHISFSREMFDFPYFRATDLKTFPKDIFFIITTTFFFFFLTCAPQFIVLNVFDHLIPPVTASCFCFTRRRLHPSRDLLGGRRLRQAVRTSAALRCRQTHGREKKTHSFPSLFLVFVLCWSAVSKPIHADTTRRLMEIKRN